MKTITNHPPSQETNLHQPEMDATQFLRDQVSTALWQLERELLVDVCRRLKCSGLDSGEPHSKTKRTLIKMAENMFDEIEGSEADGAEQFYKDLSTYIERLSKGVNQSDEEHRVEEPTPKKEPKESSLLAAPPKATSPPFKIRAEPTNTLQEVTLRREFKICGQIGEQGQKDKLSYLSLVRQIEMGIEKGHPETEIIGAVIRAVNPGLPLRDMLEIKRGLTLNKLLTILKGHYKVDSSTELYHQLISISQEPRETALNFIFRAIELKEKLLWRAANDETDELYGRATIQRKFLRSIETGLLSDAIKYHLMPLLNDLSTTDEELIERVNEASKLEIERLEKRKRSTAGKGPKVQELQTQNQADSAPLRDTATSRESHRAVAVKAVKGKEMKSENINTQQIIEELRKEMKQMFMSAMETSFRPGGSRQREKGCKRCRDEGEGENCMHCFKCGREGHYSRGCRAQRPFPGNGEGLLRGDQQ